MTPTSERVDLGSSELSGPGAFNVSRLSEDLSYKEKAYSALKDAISQMDLYSSPDPLMLDERELSEQLGVSRTPIREAVAMLQQEGFVRVLPRRGIMVIRRTKREIVEMIEAWAALESMAARLITTHASDEDIAGLRTLFESFHDDCTVLDRLPEYSASNLAFHQALIRLSGSDTLYKLTESLTVHLRAIRHRTIFAFDRAKNSLEEHLGIIDALQARDAEQAERLVRNHTLALARYVANHVNLD